MSNFKDTFTTILAVVTVVTTAVKAYLDSNTGDINWVQLGLGVILAIGLYFQGKNADGTTKSATQISIQKKDSGK